GRRDAPRRYAHPPADRRGRDRAGGSGARAFRSAPYQSVRRRLAGRPQRAMSTKISDNRAWWLVLPVVILVGFNAVIPLMTVVNYSVQETFGNNRFLFEGVKWFSEVMHSPRFHDALRRQLFFTAIVLAIQVPLGVAIALAMPRKSAWASV